jgi:2-polyprenyl-3-methyl-5-hydroxy-6-metoxy-1,4-benzoquinol methylase
MKPTNGMLLEHIARYQFAILYMKGRVLDIACGSGYGSNILAKAARYEIDEIIAVDYDNETIRYARGAYYNPLIHFQHCNAVDPQLPEKLGQFDVIVSFETIEHLAEEQQFLNNLYNMLRPGGHLILSSPFGQGRGKPTNEPFHVHQLTEVEFFDLFDCYSKKEFYYQRGVLIEPAPGRKGKHYPIGIAVCVK